MLNGLNRNSSTGKLSRGKPGSVRSKQTIDSAADKERDELPLTMFTFPAQRKIEDEAE
jgi:hypothetical protein